MILVEKALHDLQNAYHRPIMIISGMWVGGSWVGGQWQPTWLHEGVRLRRGPTAPQHALVSLEAAFKRRPA